MEKIKTFELDRWSEPDEQHRVRHIGMADAKETFEKLEAHLKEKGMLPDEYFLYDVDMRTKTRELPDFNFALCVPNFGGSEGIYLDIDLIYCDEDGEQKSLRFATGKTLQEGADAFFWMSRIAAECSLMENILTAIARIYQKNMENNENLLPFEVKDYESVKNRLYVVALNRNNNQDYLRDAVRRDITETDITSVVRVLCTNNQEKGMSSFMVKSGMLEMWGISREEIYEQALKNTERIFKPDMRNIKEILLSGCMETLSEEEQEEFRGFLNLDIPEQDQRAEKSKEILPYEQYVLTNTAKINGATAILYPNLLQEIGEATQSNFFILPSSIHEVILMKDNGDMNAEELQRMVMEINRTQVAPEEVLSDEVYSYDYRQQKLTMATSPIQTKELLDQITGMCDHGDFMEEEQEADLCMGE